MLPEAVGRGQHFQDLGHSFSLYGPPSRQITYISLTKRDSFFFCVSHVVSGANERRLYSQVSL